MNFLKLPLFILILFTLLACDKQQVELLDIPIEDDTIINTPPLDLTPENALTYELGGASCIPFTIITADPALKWLGGIHKGDQQHGKGQAYIGNYLWEASASAVKNNGRIEIVLRTAISEDQPFYDVDELLFVIDQNSDRCIPLGARNTSVVSPEEGYVSYGILDYDVLLVDYELVSSAFHQVEIIKLDTINNRISGNFTLEVKHNRTRENDLIPRQFIFENGSFDCKIIE